MEEGNSLAYYCKELVTPIKSFKLEATGHLKNKEKLGNQF
jgi:hypothetical protein